MKLEYHFTSRQEDRFIAWQSKLPPVFTGAIGGRFTYSVTPTDFGPIVKIKDQITGQELDITEYDEWVKKSEVKNENSTP